MQWCIDDDVTIAYGGCECRACALAIVAASGRKQSDRIVRGRGTIMVMAAGCKLPGALSRRAASRLKDACYLRAICGRGGAWEEERVSDAYERRLPAPSRLVHAFIAPSPRNS